MIQARPIPGYLHQPDREEDADQASLPNGQHEEINLEARRKHRQEKLPPLSPVAAEDDTAAAEDGAGDVEKILTIEQAELLEAETEQENNEVNEDEQLKRPSRGQKISNFFKNLGKKKTGSEAAAVEDETENETSPKKKQVRFFGKNKKTEDNNDDDEEDERASEPDNETKEDDKEETDEEEEEEEEEEEKANASSEAEDDVSSIEDASPKEKPKEAKKTKHVTIKSQEDVREDSETAEAATPTGPKRKKSRACVVL